MVMAVQHRFDLPVWSCVNREVGIFNRKLVKLKKMFRHDTVVKVYPIRGHFTRHGLLLNS
jgi:hypothetical protein